jgi:hypothetical protein
MMARAVAANRSRPDIALALEALMPANRRGNRNIEFCRSRTPGQSAFDRPYNPFSQIIGKRCCHPGWPPNPANRMNHISTDSGIPSIQSVGITL